MLVTEVAARNLKNGTEWETIACVLSKAFSTDDKSVEVTGLACSKVQRNRMTKDRSKSEYKLL